MFFFLNIISNFIHCGIEQDSCEGTSLSNCTTGDEQFYMFTVKKNWILNITIIKFMLQGIVNLYNYCTLVSNFLDNILLIF
jgi:hypothetical protein